MSGVAAAGALSSTLAWTWPAALRSAPATWVVGAPSASLRRNSLKSLLWATMVRVASPAGMYSAWSPAGTSSTAPALRRLTLPPMKASGLLRSSATSIWSSDTLAGLACAAIFPAVSPGLTTIFWPSAEAGRSAGAGCGAGAWATGAGLEGGGGDSAGATAGRGGAGKAATGGGAAGREMTGAVGAGMAGAAAWRRFGGSNSIV